MNLIGIGFILAFMGGIIAYYADRLGRTLGKKRLSLMGLRPRHTAEVLTVGAGAIIPVLTLCAIMAVNPDARQWLQEGSKVLAERDRAQADVKRLDKERQEKTDQLATVKSSLTSSQERLSTMQKSLGAVEIKFKAASAQLSQLTTRFAKLTSSYQQVALNLQEERGRLASLDKTFKALQGTYTGLKQSFTVLQKEKDAQAKENLRLLADNSIISQEVAQGKADSEKQKADYENRAKEFKRVQDGFERDIQTAARQLDQMQLLLERQRRTLNLDLQHSRDNPIMFQKDDEVARLSIDPGLSQVQARSALDELLRQTRAVAAERGAVATGSGMPIAAFLAADSNGNQISPDILESAIVEQITNLKEDRLLVAYVPFNEFKGEAVALGLKQFPNPLVFRDGQTIADVRVNGRLPEKDVVEQVRQFVQASVNERARQAKMIPSTNEPIISYSVSDVLDLVKQIRSEARVVKFVAQADGDTRAAGPLKLRFHYQ